MDDVHKNDPIINAELYSSAPAWNPQIRNLVILGFAALLLVLAFVFRTVLPLALTTVVIAYLLHPVTNFFTTYVTRGRRGWAVLLTFVLIIVIILLLLFILIPPLIEQSVNGIASLINIITTLITEPIIFDESNALITDSVTAEPIAITEYISTLLRDQGFNTVDEWLMSVSQDLTLDRETIQQIFNVSGNITSNLLGSIFSLAGTAVGTLFSGLFFVTILAMLLGGGNRLTETVINSAPDGYHKDMRKLLVSLGDVWNDYVRGNFILGSIMGVAMWIFATLLGLPNPLFLAFVAFSMEFVPNIGPTITMAIAAVLALANGSTTFTEMNHLTVAIIVIVVWVVMQQIEAIVLVPRIVGESLKLHPIIVILAVIWGGSFGGIIGIIIAPPLVASIRVILHYIYGRLTGRTSFSEESVRVVERVNDLIEEAEILDQIMEETGKAIDGLAVADTPIDEEPS